MRKSSAATTWLPEGEGYQVFKSIPTGQPPLAQPKPEHTWQRTEVEGTIRAWYPHMQVEQSTLQKIKLHWQQRFDSLPPDNDIEQLEDEYKLHWADLPARTTPVELNPTNNLPMCGGGEYSAHI